jgi:hypothetical protein
MQLRSLKDATNYDSTSPQKKRPLSGVFEEDEEDGKAVKRVNMEEE